MYASFWFDRDDQDRFFRRLGRTLMSLALHVVALLVVMGLRLAHGERPLAAVEVNLVSCPRLSKQSNSLGRWNRSSGRKPNRLPLRR